MAAIALKRAKNGTDTHTVTTATVSFGCNLQYIMIDAYADATCIFQLLVLAETLVYDLLHCH